MLDAGRWTMKVAGVDPGWLTREVFTGTVLLWLTFSSPMPTPLFGFNFHHYIKAEDTETGGLFRIAVKLMMARSSSDV
jgi:hypothetical protein